MKTKLFSLIALVLSLVLTTSCGNSSSTSTILEHVPDNVQGVVVLNARTMLESMGATIDDNQVQLPAYITNTLNGQARSIYDEVMATQQQSGVNIDTYAIAFNDNTQIVYVCELSDAEAFQTAFTDKFEAEVTSRDGATLLDLTSPASQPLNIGYPYSSSTRHTYVAIKDNYGYVLLYNNLQVDGSDLLLTFIANAEQRSFADTQFGSIISEGNMFGAAVNLSNITSRRDRNMLGAQLSDLLEGYLCLTGNLDGDKMTATARLYNADGTAKQNTFLQSLLATDAHINTQALQYMHNGEMLVMAANLKDLDWNNLLTNTYSRNPELRLFSGYLENIDGTVAYGFGFKNGFESIARFDRRPSVDDIAMTAVIEVKDGRAAGMLSDLQMLAAMANLPCQTTTNGFVISIQGVNINVAAIDNMLIASTNPINASNNSLASGLGDMSNYNCALGLVVDSNNPLMRDLSLTNNVTACAGLDLQQLSITATAQITGDDQLGFLGNLIKACITLSQNSRDIERRYSAATNRAFERYFYNSIGSRSDDYLLDDECGSPNNDRYSLDEECIPISIY